MVRPLLCGVSVVCWLSVAVASPRLFVQPPSVDGVEPAQRTSFEVDLVQALTDARVYEIKTMADLEASLAAEKTRDLLGCSDTSCFSELAGALDSEILTTRLVRSGVDWQVSFTVLRADGSVRARATHKQSSSFRQLLDAVPVMTAKLLVSTGDVDPRAVAVAEARYEARQASRKTTLLLAPTAVDPRSVASPPAGFDDLLLSLLTKHAKGYQVVLGPSDVYSLRDRSVAQGCQSLHTCYDAAAQLGADDMVGFTMSFSNGDWSLAGTLVSVEGRTRKSSDSAIRPGADQRTLLALAPEVVGRIVGVSIDDEVGARDTSVGRGSRVAGIAMTALGTVLVGGGLYGLATQVRQPVCRVEFGQEKCSNYSDGVRLAAVVGVYSVGLLLSGLGSGFYLDGRAGLATGNADATGSVWWRWLGWGATAVSAVLPSVLTAIDDSSGAPLAIGGVGALAASIVFIASMPSNGNAVLPSGAEQLLVGVDLPVDRLGRRFPAVTFGWGF